METIKNLIAKPAPWIYFVLVVALLIIVTNKSGAVKDLQASLDNAEAEISASETLTESLSTEIALRNDAIAGLETAIAGWEADAIEVNARLNAVDSDKGALEVEVGTLTGLVESLQTQLSTCTEASTTVQ
jgi:septal ring factor EnvC (AmiA/AmiB activator)